MHPPPPAKLLQICFLFLYKTILINNYQFLLIFLYNSIHNNFRQNLDFC
ncbi:Uncharacterised protein [Helicobacter mustelae]|nr:Uncharacterised protein [Helicobacter mustelae]